EIVFSGPGGHSWSDAGIVNPVHAVSRAITLFTDRCADAAGQGAGRSFNFGLIEGGTSINAIPATARAKVDLRAEREEDLEPWVQLLGAVVEEAVEAENQRAVAGKLTGKLREIGFRPGGQLPADSPLLACIRAVDAHLGIRSRLDSASTDANIPLSLGVPAISVGAGGQGGGAHTEAEWYHPEGRDLGLKRILLLVCLLLQRETWAL
ncbi:MAG: peptidase dimerization domain-containing protein, partial [Bryobacteraceae bacterium]